MLIVILLQISLTSCADHLTPLHVPPASTARDVADFLHIQVERVTWIVGDDLAKPTQVFPLWSAVSDQVRPEPVQPSCHRPNTTQGMASICELAGDPTC